MTTNVSAGRVPIPAQLDELTASWFSRALDCQVSAVGVIDAHSGTTGRARVRLTSGGAVPDTLFVKLLPFSQDQRELIRQVGLGVAEIARPAMIRATEAVEDLDAVGLLEERLGRR